MLNKTVSTHLLAHHRPAMQGSNTGNSRANQLEHDSGQAKVLLRHWMVVDSQAVPFAKLLQFVAQKLKVDVVIQVVHGYLRQNNT